MIKQSFTAEDYERMYGEAWTTFVDYYQYNNDIDELVSKFREVAAIFNSEEEFWKWFSEEYRQDVFDLPSGEIMVVDQDW